MPNPYFLPLRKIIPIWPNDIISSGDNSILDKIGVDDFDIDFSKDGVVIEGTIIITEQLSFEMPAIDGVSIAILANGNLTSLSFSFEMDIDTFHLRIIDSNISIRIRSDLLKPMKAEGNKFVPDDKAKFVELNFTPTINVNNREGIFFENTPSLSFQPFMVGNTNVIIEASDIIFAFRENDMALVPATIPRHWRGLYIKNAIIHLPDISVALASDIQLNDFFIGSGGFCGKITGHWIPQLAADKKSFTGNGAGTIFGIPFALKEINLEFDRNTFKTSKIQGAIIFPFFDEPALVDIQLSDDGDFKVILSEEQTLPLGIPQPQKENGFFVFTKQDLMKLTIKSLSAHVKPESLAEISIDEGKCLILLGRADSFLRKYLPAEGLEIDFGLSIGWSSEHGIYLKFKGETGFEVVFPVHKTISGVLTIESIYMAVQAKKSDIDLVIAVTGNIELGPVKGSVDRMGLLAKFTFPQGGGNLGRANVALDFKPPDGAGLMIEAGPVVGGGYLFFDREKEEYAGIMMLEIQSAITLKAIGLITTRMPDGSKGFSLLIIITVEDFTPIQLGYGFTLNGVGGLLGVNRTAMVEVLRSGIKNHTLDSILFPKDPIKNAPKIISDLRAVFPPQEKRFLIGPMAIIGWGKGILKIELGIVLELPEPVRLMILGKVTVILPPLKEGQSAEEYAVVLLHNDSIGIINFEKKEASLDATLYDSRILRFTLTGDTAVRVNWGKNSNFILSVGGFNPRFNVPAGFPKLNRMAISMAFSDVVQLRLESYFAVTSNTVQIGAHLGIYAKKGKFSLAGYFGFDALFQFSPSFQFIADLEGGVALKVGSESLMSVQMSVTLSGPSPWHAVGRAEFKILWFKKSVDFDETIGDSGVAQLPPPIDIDYVYSEFKKELEDIRNWSAQLPAGNHMLVSLRKITAPKNAGSKELLVHPFSELTVRQRVVPLEVEISKFGTAVIRGEQRIFKITGTQIGNDSSKPPVYVEESFARAQFFEMTDDERLSNPSFEQMKAGIRFSTESFSFNDKDPITDTFEYDEEIYDFNWKSSEVGGYIVPDDVLDAQVSRSAVGQAVEKLTMIAKAETTAFKLHDTNFVVASTDKLIQRDDVQKGPSNYTVAAENLRKHLAEYPEERGLLQVVPGHEVQIP